MTKVVHLRNGQKRLLKCRLDRSRGKAAEPFVKNTKNTLAVARREEAGQTYGIRDLKHEPHSPRSSDKRELFGTTRLAFSVL